MSIQTNQAIARRYLADFWNLGDTSAISEIVAVDAVGHVAGQRITAGPKMLLARRASLLGIYTNPTFTAGGRNCSRRQGGAALDFPRPAHGAGVPQGKEIVAPGSTSFASWTARSPSCGSSRTTSASSANSA